MNGYQCFMRSVSRKFLIFFLISSFVYQGYADCSLVEASTKLEDAASKVGKGTAHFFTGDWGNISFDEKLLKYVSVRMVRDQGIDGYFNPQIEVCNYEGNKCKKLYNGTNCHNVYGTQVTGGGVSAAVFIDWKGDKTKSDKEIVKGLAWDWAEGVTDEEKKKFANSPKICACSQKGACMGDWKIMLPVIGSIADILHSDNTGRIICDTCYQDKIKCAPIPLAPGPQPFCDQLEYSSPQVRIVPIANNDYFNPKIGVMISGVEERKELNFPDTILDSKNISLRVVSNKGIDYYFKTYRKEGKLCAEYYGTEKEASKIKLQFPARCFPAPPAPQPEIVEVISSNNSRESVLRIKMKMSKETCSPLKNAAYNDGSCIFNIDNNTFTKVGPLSLKVAKPAMTRKIKHENDDVLEKILNSNNKFKILKKYGCVPGIEIKCEELDVENKCKLDNSGSLNIQVKYQKENTEGEMLCISGWKPEPEEFVLKRKEEIISLRSMGTSYAKYVPIYSEESKRIDYFPRNETIDLLAQPQNKLDNLVFDRQGYIFLFTDKDHEEKKLCVVKKDSELDKKKDSDECRVVYKLIDSEYKEECKDGDDGCICNNGCSRTTQYVRKDNNQPFFLQIQKQQDGGIELQERPTRTKRTEVFYADKLCTFDLKGLKSELSKAIIGQLGKKKSVHEEKYQRSYTLSGNDDYTGDLSQYEYVEIEAWGGGEAGHIKDKVFSTENRLGMPGDYIKTKLKIDPNYPFIKVQVTEGGGGKISVLSDKDGGPTIIEMCKRKGGACKLLMTVAGGGINKVYGDKRDIETKVHREGKTKIIKAEELRSTEDNQVAYIKDSVIKYKTVSECNDDYINQRETKNLYGAGGCIDKSKGIYGKGLPGHAIIKPIMYEINENQIGNLIKDIVDIVKDNNTNIDSHDVIKILDPDITKTIEREIKKELSCEDKGSSFK